MASDNRTNDGNLLDDDRKYFLVEWRFQIIRRRIVIESSLFLFGKDARFVQLGPMVTAMEFAFSGPSFRRTNRYIV